MGRKAKPNAKRRRINPTFTDVEYDQISNLAGKENKAKAEVVRDWAIEGLNGQLTKDNIEYLTPIIRRELQSVIGPYMERMISLMSKAGIQAGAAAYLSAEAIAKFVPPEDQQDVQETYMAARKKAVGYMRKKLNVDDEMEE